MTPEALRQMVKLAAEARVHRCAVCPKPLPRGMLMCLAHWKLVPHVEQQEVYRTWGALQRSYPRRSSDEYFAARDKAIASAKARITPPTGEATT